MEVKHIEMAIDTNQTRPVKIDVREPQQKMTGAGTQAPQSPSNATDISFDKDANVFVIKFMNNEKEVVQQVPAQVMIEFAKSVNKIQGMIIDEKA